MECQLNINGWNKLAYWQSGEWQVIEERLDELSTQKGQYCPARGKLFAALRAVHPDACRVAIVGQDPYPNLEHACGIAFSVPPEVIKLPPTLVNILKEYQADLAYPAPKNGDLRKWCEQGVLLWNAYPSCAVGRPGSHRWPEWELLTQQIMERLDGQAVFCFLGRDAQRLSRFVQASPTFKTSHPSPLGCHYGFIGSHLFSNINQLLVNFGKEPINWRLDDGQGERDSFLKDKRNDLGTDTEDQRAR